MRPTCPGGTSPGGGLHPERATVPGGSQALEQPNIVVIVVDDWAQSDLEASRSDSNPWNNLIGIDALAAQGQSWLHFYSQPLCHPTRQSLISGEYSGKLEADICDPPTAATPSGPASLAWPLRNSGYSTASFGKWHIGTSPDPQKSWADAPGEYGFDASRAMNASNFGRSCGSTDYTQSRRADDGPESATAEYHTEAVGLAFMDWWQQAEGPRFAYVCFQAAHSPFHTPPSHLLPNGLPPLTTQREKYESMLVAMDSMFTTMMGVIDLQDTYVLLFGDNGTPRDAIRPEQNINRVK